MAINMDIWETLSYSDKFSCQQSTPFDCSFVVGTGVNVKTVGAHKSVLVRSSSFFERMFNGKYKESDAAVNIPLPNVLDYTDFNPILEYIYYKKTDAIQFLSIERLKHVAYLADYFSLDNLLDACHIKIEKQLTEYHTSFYDFLHVFEYEKKLNRKISSFLNGGSLYQYEDINQRFPYTSGELLTNTSMHDLEPSYFYDLIKVLAYHCKACECFTLIEYYAKIHGLEMEKFSFQNIQNSDNLVQVVNSATAMPERTLKEMFELIDFKKMSAYQFKTGPVISKVWTVSAEDKLQILSGLR